MRSRWLPWLQLRLLTLLILVGILCGLIVANTRGRPTVLGHVQIRSGPGWPGLFIFGWEYGWPWVYRTESFKGELFAGTGFDRLDRLAFLKNAGVGVSILVGAAVIRCGGGRGDCEVSGIQAVIMSEPHSNLTQGRTPFARLMTL
jgi:hypothetical protein